MIEQNLSSDNERTDASTSLVLGAGGTCRAAVYALHKAGFKTIYLFNRTRPNADKIVESFPKDYNIIPLTSLDSFPGELPVAIISTIPAQGTATKYAPNPDAGVTVPDSVLAREDGGVLIDVSSSFMAFAILHEYWLTSFPCFKGRIQAQDHTSHRSR